MSRWTESPEGAGHRAQVQLSWWPVWEGSEVDNPRRGLRKRNTRAVQ